MCSCLDFIKGFGCTTIVCTIAKSQLYKPVIYLLIKRLEFQLMNR